MTNTVMTIVGARPQFIKAAVVSHAFRKHSNIQELLVHTGQHFDANMSSIFFDEMEIPTIDYHLGIKGSTQGKQTGEMIIAIEELLIRTKPNWVLIYGDTNSTLAAAVAAAKLHIPIAHVEAGLRSYNRQMPEEINRLAADHFSEILFTPTALAKRNLHDEGFAENRIVEVGDVMFDAAIYYSAKAERTSSILTDLYLKSKEYILATVHRAENTDNPQNLLTIFKALGKIAHDIPIILPLHPRTRNVIVNTFPEILSSTSIQLIDPVGFLDMIMLEKNARTIVTDSGGVQKEAFFYQVPCVTLRKQTEWVETVELNWNSVIEPIDENAICAAIKASLSTVGKLNQHPYGKGDAAQKIVNHLSMRMAQCVYG